MKDILAEEKANIKIGGRNLALRTNQGVFGWAWNLGTGGAIIEEIIEDGIKCCKLTRNDVAQSGWSVIEYLYIQPVKYKPDTEYTVSFEVKPSVNCRISFSLIRGNGLDAFLEKAVSVLAVKQNKWNKVTCVIKTLPTLPTPTDQLLYIMPSNSDVGVSYTFRNLKIEKGNFATDWTPAPEDMISLPVVTSGDNDKFLRVVNGSWAAVSIANAEGSGF